MLFRVDRPTKPYMYIYSDGGSEKRTNLERIVKSSVFCIKLVKYMYKLRDKKNRRGLMCSQDISESCRYIVCWREFCQAGGTPMTMDFP